MLIFIYGEDEYRVKMKQKERMEDFIKKYPDDMSRRTFDFSESQAFEDFKIFTGSLSMFSESKLAVILEPEALKNFEDFKNFFERHELGSASQMFLIVMGGDFKEKKYTDLFDFLLKSAKEIHKIDKLSGARLFGWIKQEVKKRGGVIDDSAASFLAVLFKGDSGCIANEIDKLIAYKFKEKISEKDVLAVCGDKFSEEKIFSLTDKIFSGQRKEALFLLEKLLITENADFIFNILIGQIRNLIKIKFNAGEIKFQPFYIRKMTDMAHNYNLEQLKKIYEELAQIDASVKTGKITYKEGLENFVFKINDLFPANYPNRAY